MTHSIGAEQMTRLLGAWNQNGAAYSELAMTLHVLIDEGRLPVGARIPAERVLAAKCGISRNTVTAAYGILREMGYLKGVRGAGTFTATPPGPDGRIRTVAWAAPEPIPGVIDLGIATLPAKEPEFGNAVHAAAGELDAYSGTGGYDLVGIPALRQAIADRYTHRGLPTSADEIMVTVGARHAWGLIMRLFSGRHEQILVDSPTSPNALAAILSGYRRPLSIGLGHDGWDVDLIDSTLSQVKPVLAFLMSDFHNPTGLTMTLAQRKTIAEAVQRSGTYLVIDDTLAELALEGQSALPSMASFGGRSRTIVISSLSKTCWGGLRVGWIRAARSVIERIAASRGPSDAGNPIIQQLVAVHMLDGFDVMLADRQRLLGAQRDVLVKALRDRLPRWQFQVPAGGLALWVDLGERISAKLSAAAPSHGAQVLAGWRFGTEGALDRFLRLPFTLDEATLVEGVNRLALAYEDVAGRSRHAIALSGVERGHHAGGMRTPSTHRS